MSADQRLAELGLTLPSAPRPIGNYLPFRLAGNLLFLSGVGPQLTPPTCAQCGLIRAEAGWPSALKRLPVSVTSVPSTFRMEKS